MIDITGRKGGGVGKRFLPLACLVALLNAPFSPIAQACPYCKADAAGLAGSDPSELEHDGTWPLMISGGLDVPTAYFFRGYLQADRGLILQPYLNVFAVHSLDDVVVRPYVSMFNSTHFDDGNRMGDMFDAMVGGVASWNGAVLDVRYAYYNMSPLMRSHVHEIGGRLSYDLLTPWKDADWAEPFSVKPFAGVFGEISDENGTDDVFVNVGIEPIWRFDVASRRVAVSLPTEWGLSGDGYYLDSSGNNATFGYFATALTGTLSLASMDNRGEWLLNGSLQYLHLGAASTRNVNGGDRDECIAKLGLAFVY